MDFQFIRERPSQFASQIYKYYDEDENIIKYYLCKEHLLILSTKKLYVFYCESYIDYTYDYLSKINFYSEKDTLTFEVKNKKFTAQFINDKQSNEFNQYLVKYKK
jgi:hypothetical protein